MSAEKLNTGKNRLAFEFTPDYLKMIFLKGGQDKPELNMIEIIPVKDRPDQEVIEKIKDLVKTSKIKVGELVLSIPVSSGIIKTAQIPSVNEAEIKDILNLQAGRQTPYPREELVVDYLVLGQIQGVYTKVLIIMIPLVVVNRQIAILSAAGLKINYVVFSAEGLGAYSIKTHFSGGQLIPEHAILNIDTDSSDLSVIGSNGVMFTRSIPVGANQIYQFKESILPKFVEEAKKSIEAFQAEDVGKNPSIIYVTGAVKYRDIVCSSISQGLGTEAKPFILRDSLAVNPQCEANLEPEDGATILSAVACASEAGQLKLNLIPDEVKLQRRFEEKARKVITAGILAMVIFFQFCLILVAKMYSKERFLLYLKGKYKENIGEAEKLGNISERTGSILKYIEDRNAVIEVLVKLSEMLPEDIYLKGVTMDKEGKVFIKGTSKTMSRIFVFVKDLETSGFFTSVKTEYTESKKQDGEDVSDFGIAMELEKADI